MNGEDPKKSPEKEKEREREKEKNGKYWKRTFFILPNQATAVACCCDQPTMYYQYG